MEVVKQGKKIWGCGDAVEIHMVTIEALVPEDHFLRKLDAALDLSFVSVKTHDLYSHKHGRPPIDPVMMVKYLLVDFLYGIPSKRQIEQRIITDAALRWYVGLDLFERVPDHSTISQLRRRKPKFRNYDLFGIYDYDGYANDFIQWRRATIAKVEQLEEDELYSLEDQILRHKGFDPNRFSKNPIVGKLSYFITELIKPFVEKPYRTAFYTQLEAITKKVIRAREKIV